MRLLQALAACFVVLGLPSTSIAATISDEDAEAIGRTAYAESGSFLGRLAVIETILNRLHEGGFGGSVQDIINAPGQFEPVMRAGGTWRNLPPLSEVQKRDLRDMLWVHEQGTLTIAKGATFFQNERVVSDRAARGVVRRELVGFNGMQKVAEWHDGHSFYRPGKPVARVAAVKPESPAMRRVVSMMVFGGE